MKENENYDQVQKNLIIYNRLKKMKQPLNVQNIKNKIKNQSQSTSHVNSYSVNRKKESKRIDDDNKKFHKRLKVLKSKYLLFFNNIFNKNIKSISFLK